MVGGGRRPDRAFLSKAKKSDGPSEQRAPAQPDPAEGRGSPKLINLPTIKITQDE
ncbi:hypothetical protein SGRA_2375 [Saprospira grandis str. Lewin]|uniref:Uncharacterized protein n=1 Tax=Saprospira grandis (strain Lewin) TaxID=984262 RepID=H6L4S9_SAPGL|nr:hypothetical protein SGRA_2375 [Saprospira grandis str. Lewin]